MEDRPAEDGPREKAELVRCPRCGRYMVRLLDFRKMCKECFERMNRAGQIADEQKKWEAERRAWLDEERRLWGQREVG